MKYKNQCLSCIFLLTVVGLAACSSSAPTQQSKPLATEWEIDFIDEFNEFNSDNWQDQMVWVNNEIQCYVPDNQHGTREVSNGTIKLKVVKLETAVDCANVDKHGKKHSQTQYVAGRIASKNRQEFVKGKWTARLKTWGNGQPGMFPAWWLLGARNNEPPVQENDENVCWPLTGSGEIDIFEHHGNGGANHYVSRVINSLGACDKGDWESMMKIIDADLDE